MANFIKNFKNQNFKDGLSSKWNGSLQYVYDQNGSYILTPTTEEVKVILKNFQVENIDEIKKNCKKENKQCTPERPASFLLLVPLALSSTSLSANLTQDQKNNRRACIRHQ